MTFWLQDTINRYGSTRLLESYTFKSRQVRMRLPLFVGCSIPNYFLERANTMTCDRVNISVFSNIVSHHGDVFGLDQSPVVPGQLGYIPQLASSIQGELNIEPHVVFDGVHILNSVHHSAHNFYHFMIDYLCYIKYKDSGTEPWMPFFLIKETKDFHSQATALLKQHLSFYYLPTTYLHRKLAIPSLLNKTDVVDFLKLSSQHIPSSGCGRRIYITRKNAQTRRVVNEEELIPHLLAFGFEIVDNESLSLTDQIALFKAASVVCAPHGAGLTNIAFCKEGTSVIEFFLAERLPLSGLFWELGCAAHLLYTFVRAERVPNPNNLHPTEGDLFVLPADLNAALSQTLISTGQ